MRIYAPLFLLLLGGCSAVTVVDEQRNSAPVVVTSQATDATTEVAINTSESIQQETVAAVAEPDLTVKPANLNDFLRPQLPGAQVDKLPKNLIEHWLQEAKIAWQEDSLTTPAGNSAFDLYKKVLQNQPDHPIALAGLEAIVQKYIVFAETSIANNNLEETKRYLQRANRVKASHPKVRGMQSRIDAIQNQLVAKNEIDQTTKKNTVAAKKKPEQTPKPSAPDINKKPATSKKYAPLQSLSQSLMKVSAGYQKQRILLPAKAAQSRDKQLISYLRRLAKQIAQVDGRLIISAPKDSTVRWLYKVLNETDENYRIRANIQHQSPVAIQITYVGKQPTLDVFN